MTMKLRISCNIVKIVISIVFSGAIMSCSELRGPSQLKYTLYSFNEETRDNGSWVTLHVMVLHNEPRYILAEPLLVDPPTGPFVPVNAIECLYDNTVTNLYMILSEKRGVVLDIDTCATLNYELKNFEAQLAKIQSNGTIVCSIKVPLLAYSKENGLVLAEVMHSAPLIVTMVGGEIKKVNSKSQPSHIMVFNSEISRSFNGMVIPFDDSFALGHWVKNANIGSVFKENGSVTYSISSYQKFENAVKKNISRYCSKEQTGATNANMDILSQKKYINNIENEINIINHTVPSNTFQNVKGSEGVRPKNKE